MLADRMLQQDSSKRFQDIDEIKRELIARGEQHVSLQKLSKLKDTVVPQGEIDDPLIFDPMKIVDIDWDNGNLSIKLNHPINQNWIWALGNMGGYTSVMGKDPSQFQFNGNVARISAASHEAQDVVNYFKQWIPRANQAYEHKLKSDIKMADQKQKAELQKRIKEEEERARVKQSLRF